MSLESETKKYSVMGNQQGTETKMSICRCCKQSGASIEAEGASVENEAVESYCEAIGEIFTVDAETVVTHSEAAGSHHEVGGEILAVDVDSGVTCSSEAVDGAEAEVKHYDGEIEGEDSGISEGEYVHRHAFVIRVLPEEEDSGSEVQFRVAPLGNIPPAPVDPHSDVRPRAVRPSWIDVEGTAAGTVPSTSRSRTSEVEPGYGATVTLV